ncbi:myb-like protein X [Scylla paramamosain]|uniref:myb-like protein X n=1 Tax=Scylla paramamosain TaxID=85552 RepID=UPI0030827CCB
MHSFNNYMRGVCVVENGDILHGPPRRVKVSVQDPNATTLWCCCWPRGPRFNKVAGFRFNHEKIEAGVHKYTSLESAMYMDGMVFREYWTPGEAAVKVSVKQRRGKKVVLYSRLATFLDEMRDREADKFVLYVTETSFKIIKKERTSSEGEQAVSPKKEISEASEKKGVYDKRGDDEMNVKTNYMTSLLSSFKEKGNEPKKILTSPEIINLPPLVPMLTEGAKNWTASSNSFCEKAPAAQKHQRSASRTVRRDIQPCRNNETLEKEGQMVQAQRSRNRDTGRERKDAADGKETATQKEHEEHKAEKEETDIEDVIKAAPEKKKRDKEEKAADTEIVTNCPPKEENMDKVNKEDTERDFAEKEEEPEIMSQVKLAQEKGDEDAVSKEDNPREGKENDIWEDYYQKEEANIEDVKNAASEKDYADQEEMEDTDSEFVSEKDKEGGIQHIAVNSNMQMVQDTDDEDSESEEKDPSEEHTGTEEHEQETKKETDAEEVNTVPPLKDYAEEEEKQDFEKGVEKEDIIEKVILPSLTKFISLTNVRMKNSTRRENIRKKRERVLPDYKKTKTPVEKIVRKENTGKEQDLKKKILSYRPITTVNVNVTSRWRWWKTSPPTPVKKVMTGMKVKKKVNLRKKKLPVSHKRNVSLLKRNRKASGGKEKRYKKMNVKSVQKCKIDTHNTLPSDYVPDLDLSVLASQPPPPGPARVKWAREVAALKMRLRSQKQNKGRTGGRSIVHGSRAAKH